MSRKLPSIILSSCVPGNPCFSHGMALLPRRTFSLASVKYTFVLKHERQPRLIDLEGKKRNQIFYSGMTYNVLENVAQMPSPPLQVHLLKNVPGRGRAGDIVYIPRNICRMFLLPEGKAEYVTPQVLATYEERKKAELLNPKERASSATSEYAVSFLQSKILNIPMNMHNPWKLEKWHIRSALRQEGIWMEKDDSAVELPAQDIVGPHSDQHGKCFSVFITINDKERACLLCRIELRCKDPADALPPLDPSPLKPLEFDELFPGAVSPLNTPPSLTVRYLSKKQRTAPRTVRDF